MKEQTEIKKADDHFFKGRIKRLIIALAIVLAISFIALVVFLYLHSKKDRNTQSAVDNNLGTITAIENTPATQAESGKINTTPETKNAVGYFNDGQAAMSAQSWDKAVEDFDQAINLDNKVPDYYNRKSQAQYNLGQKDQAINTLKDGIANNPDSDLLKSRLDILQKDWVGSQPQ